MQTICRRLRRISSADTDVTRANSDHTHRPRRGFFAIGDHRRPSADHETKPTRHSRANGQSSCDRYTDIPRTVPRRRKGRKFVHAPQYTSAVSGCITLCSVGLRDAASAQAPPPPRKCSRRRNRSALVRTSPMASPSPFTLHPSPDAPMRAYCNGSVPSKGRSSMAGIASLTVLCLSEKASISFHRYDIRVLRAPSMLKRGRQPIREHCPHIHF